jgi:uncharacterized paraquat-inducible protein A
MMPMSGNRTIDDGPWAACWCCGLVQAVPSLAPEQSAYCPRCETLVAPAARAHQSTQATAAFALAALVLYFPAILLPMLRIEKLGSTVEDSLLSGIATLMQDGHYFVGGIVLVFSLIVPPIKLFALLLLSLASDWVHERHRAITYHVVELLGRWGMLDVMVVAVLVAYVKLGDTVTISPGPGLAAFATSVILSLIASMCFPPHALWSEAP